MRFLACSRPRRCVLGFGALKSSFQVFCCFCEQPSLPRSVVCRPASHQRLQGAPFVFQTWNGMRFDIPAAFFLLLYQLESFLFAQVPTQNPDRDDRTRMTGATVLQPFCGERQGLLAGSGMQTTWRVVNGKCGSSRRLDDCNSSHAPAHHITPASGCTPQRAELTSACPVTAFTAQLQVSKGVWS